MADDVTTCTTVKRESANSPCWLRTVNPPFPRPVVSALWIRGSTAPFDLDDRLPEFASRAFRVVPRRHLKQIKSYIMNPTPQLLVRLSEGTGEKRKLGAETLIQGYSRGSDGVLATVILLQQRQPEHGGEGVHPGPAAGPVMHQPPNPRSSSPGSSRAPRDQPLLRLVVQLEVQVEALPLRCQHVARHCSTWLGTSHFRMQLCSPFSWCRRRGWASSRAMHRSAGSSAGSSSRGRSRRCGGRRRGEGSGTPRNLP